MPAFRSVAALLLLATCLLSSAATAQDGGPSSYWFEVEALDNGLGVADEALVDRDTPQATLETFQYLTAAKQYDAAARTLDLRSVPEELRADIGPELARKLEAVLKRRVWVDWDALPDRPDGLHTQGGKRDAMAGQPRRSIRLSLVDLDGRPVPIRLNRLKPKNGDPAWMFSRESVENIDALYRTYGPTKLEKIIPSFLRTNLLLGLELWEIFVLPILLAGSAFGGLLVYRVLGRAARNDKSDLAASFAAAVRLPFAIGVGTLLFWLCLKYVLSFNGAVSVFLDPLIATLLVLAGALLVMRVIDAFLNAAIDRNVGDLESDDGREDRDFYTNISGARRLVTVIALLFGVGLVVSQTNVLTNMGLAALGSASVLTLILAFAGREALSNVMSSLQIAFSKPARIGDTLIFDDDWVTVEKINFTFVELRTWDGRRLIVPVTTFVSTNFENMSKTDPEMFRGIYLVLDHRAPIDELRQAFFDRVRDDDRTASMDDAAVEVVRHDREGMHVRFKVNTTGPSAGWALSLDVREHLLAEARRIEQRTGAPVLPVERELQIGSKQPGLAQLTT